MASGVVGGGDGVEESGGDSVEGRLRLGGRVMVQMVNVVVVVLRRKKG